MNNDKKDKKIKILETIAIVIGVAVILTAISGVAYGYFTAVITGNNTASSNKVTTGTLDVEFTTSQYFNNSNANLIPSANFLDEAEKSIFTVKAGGTGTVTSVKYNISLTDLVVSTHFRTADLKWELRKGGTSVANGNFASIGAATSLTLTTNQTVSGATVDSWTLYIGLIETSSNQISLLGGSFSGKVKIDAVNN